MTRLIIFGVPTLVAAPSNCPNAENHEPHPSEMYFAEWAEEMARTHDQVRCDGCGLFALWVVRS